MTENFNCVFSELSEEQQLRFDLAVIHRFLVDQGWNEGVVNHLTVMLPDSDNQFLALPYGVHWALAKSSDFLVVDFDGEVISGSGEIEKTNLNIHSALHANCPGARAILHTHQKNITTLTTLQDQTVLMTSQHALRFAGRIAYLDEYGDPDKPEIGGAVVSSLSNNDILMCANHGVIVCRPSLWDAFDDLYFLDRACELQLAAYATGQPQRVIADEQALELSNGILQWSKVEGEKHFSALRKMYFEKCPQLLL